MIPYNPSFDRSAIGKYNNKNNFLSIMSGSDSYLLEDEINEQQWQQIYEDAKLIESTFGSGVVHNLGNGQRAKDCFEVVDTNKIKIKKMKLLIAGHIFNIPETIIDVHPNYNENDYNYVYIDCAFKVVSPTDTLYENGDMNHKTVIANNIMDGRINKPTTYRVQKQSYINYQEQAENFLQLDSYFTKIKYSNFTNELIYQTCTNDYVPMSFDDYLFGYALLQINDTEDITSMSQINILAKDVVLKDYELQQKIDDLTVYVSNLQQSINSLEVEKSYYEKYGLYMSAPTEITQGFNNKVSFIITGYDFNDENDFVFQITNIGNNYAAQIGEVWTTVNGVFLPDKINTCVWNTGQKNIMFMFNHFKKTNNEIASATINSAGGGNSTLISYTNGFTVRGQITDISGWNKNNCIVCVQPLYIDLEEELDFTNPPSIGDIWVNDSNSNSSLSVYTSGAANIPLQVFIINKDLLTDKVKLYTFDLTTTDTLVNDAFGNHHQYIQRNIDCNFVMLSTPIKNINVTTIPDIGELYVTPGDTEFIVSSTSNGTGSRGIKLKALVFEH